MPFDTTPDDDEPWFECPMCGAQTMRIDIDDVDTSKMVVTIKRLKCICIVCGFTHFVDVGVAYRIIIGDEDDDE